MFTQIVTTPEALIRASSPQVIVDRLEVVAKRMRRWKRWLTTRHPYNKNLSNVLRPSNRQQQLDVDGEKLGEYIASSAPLHLADGWNYLSRAFDAASHGDRASAYHLAYYAELRAAISLLATEGIGIFNRCHIALNGNLEPTEYRDSTHRATWKALSAWSMESGRAERLLRSITIESKSLAEWLTDVGVVQPSQQLVAQEWLQAWSVDLRILPGDQLRRNEMSYRPTRIRVPAPQSVDPLLELVAPLFNAWTELEPRASGTCASLDLSLLRQALQLVVDEGICNYSSFDKALESLQQEMPVRTYEALKTGSVSAASIFQEARIQNFQSKSATPILARGLLMLRLASASTASLIEAASVSKEDLEFWWSPLGTDLGLWRSPTDYERFSDLWSDVADAKDDADAGLSAIQGDPSVQSVAGILARDVSLKQFSRAPMWLLGLD